MTIINNEGTIIEVTNLKKAIEQAVLFANFEHADKAYKKNRQVFKGLLE